MKKKNIILFSIIIVSFLISAASVFILPIMEGLDEVASSNASMVLGAMFWIGTILGFIFKAILVKINKKKGNVLPKDKLGLIKFFQNKPGKIIDSILILSIIVIIISQFVEINNLVVIIGLFLFIVSIELHFVFNGKCYKYLKNIK